MNTIKETPQVSKYLRCPKFISAIQNIGTDENLDADKKRIIVLVNTLALVTGATALIIGPLMAIMLDMPITWKAGWVEMSLFALVFILNYTKRHTAASMLMLCVQNFAILYFGILFGISIPVQMLSLCFANAGLFIFRTKALRYVAVCVALFSIIALGVNAQYSLISPPQSSIDNQNTIYWFAIGIIIPLNIIISLFYVNQNDQHRRSLEQANAFKSMFVSQVVHELRNVLNAVVCIAELQKRQSKLNRETNPLTDLLFAASDSMRSIINNVLDITQIEAGKLDTPEEETFLFSKFFETIITLNQPRARKRNIKLEFTISDNIPRVIVSDTVKLNVIITNLITNAIKYADPNSIIAIKATKIGNNGSLCLAVTNQCPDIPLEKQAIIFDSFVTDKRNKSTEGTGLGLYITHNKVISLGGKIFLKSENGLTTFTVLLPLKEGKPEDIAIESNEVDIDLSSINILVADDNELNIALFSKFLTLLGCTVTTAGNGEEVIKELRTIKQLPELIILDSQMPIMNGEETVKRLQSDPVLKSIPVIISTGASLQETAEVYTQYGIIDYILKPIDPFYTQQVIKKYVSPQ